MLLLATAGCKEEGGIKVTSFTFHGANAVTPAQLRSVLATTASSKLPWGQKHYFSRDQFEADLKRIVAFYRTAGIPTRGSPRSTRSSIRIRPRSKVTVNIAEGEPIQCRAGDVRRIRGAAGPASERARIGAAAQKAGQPLDRALIQASREAALDELQGSRLPLRRGADQRGARHRPAQPGGDALGGARPALDLRPDRNRRQRQRQRQRRSAGSSPTGPAVRSARARSARASAGSTARSCSSSPTSSRSGPRTSRPRSRPASR